MYRYINKVSVSVLLFFNNSISSSICKLLIRSKIYNCTFKNTNKVSITIITTTYQLALFIFAFQISVFDATSDHILGGNKLQRFNAFLTNNTGSLIRPYKKKIDLGISLVNPQQ